MAEKPRLFRIGQPNERPFTFGDLAVLLGLAVLLYLGVRLVHDAPRVIQGPKINLTPASLPLYASLSVGRMLAAYLLSLLFSMETMANWGRYAELFAYDDDDDIFFLELEGSRV